MTTPRQHWPMWIAVFLILAGVSLRVARHYELIDLPPNFAPVSALAMFSAVYLPRRWASIIPLGLMLLSDALIGFDFWPITLAIYLSFGFSSWLGTRLRQRWSVLRLGSATIIGAVAFFLVTNAAVWLFTDMYSTGWAGLWQSYVAGLPFFRNTLAGDLFYTSSTFGLYNAVVVYLKKRRLVSNPALPNG